ncbi:MAG: DUF3160 domain-containing protein [Lachnospiraceae bacterium]|nr:DUF3160 domain-containing protein [Lachnospiraceae bacterium]
MFCPKCGSEIPDGGKFCSVCGAKLEEGTAQSPKGSSNSTKTVLIVVGIIAAVLILVFAGAVILFKKVVKNYMADTSAVEEQVEEYTEIYEDEDESADEEDTDEEDTDEAAGNDEFSGDIKSLSRKELLPYSGDESEVASITPSVNNIPIADDMSNVINIDEYEYHDKAMLDKLKNNGFVVAYDAGREFFEIYEDNRYLQVPSFVTVDSMMHTYHVYFSYLMRRIEKEHLYDELKDLTDNMLEESYDQYLELEGSEWEEAALRNVTFFSVATVLLDDSAPIPTEVMDKVKEEYGLVMSAQGVVISSLTGDYEDYSQYKPRGYYEGDEVLEKYFRAMMWYGRRQFTQKDEDLDRSALLITLALDKGNYEKWSSIYAVTSFFAGASDDLGYCEYMPVIGKVYGESVETSDLVGDDAKWRKFHKLTAKLRAPRINSIPIEDTEENKDEDNVIPGYRFMGQRFTIDATIMQELVYRRVGEFEDTDKRYLPDLLDVPAALGSDEAYSILKDMGVTKYKNYDRNMDNMRKEFINDDSSIWNASLYAGWLNTLRPLLEEKGKGYPFFMQNKEWTKKNLETFAGSFTELKHDTVLYSKQMMAEMGGGWEEDKDFRGYVEPEPLVYLRFENLARNTANGLKELGYLSGDDEVNLEKLADLASKLKEISLKELKDETLDDDEYELIEIYGGEIEHFWYDAMKGRTGDEYPSTEQFPAALVVDVATDPNGSVLEMGTGDPSVLFVIVPVEGKLRIARGAVFDFYQFEQPISERMTDSEWRKKLGIEIENYEDFSSDKPDKPEKPEWTKSYRYER